MRSLEQIVDLFTDASNATDNAAMSKHRLSPYIGTGVHCASAHDAFSIGLSL